MKICSCCKKVKELKEFNKNKTKKDGYSTLCRQCSNERSKSYYRENTSHHRDVITKRKKENRSINQNKLLDILKSSSCKDCGNSDVRVLEFDHISDDKYRNVADLLGQGYGWEVIQKEINKCEIVCANCHRIRTIERTNDHYRKLLCSSIG